MNSIKRLGVLYGRIGLATDGALIERRSVGVAAACDALDAAAIARLVRRAFGLGQPSASSGFLNGFHDKDPTFDVAAEDVEAALLAAAILDYKIEENDEQSALAALAVVTAAASGLRRPAYHDGLVREAERMLAYSQGAREATPDDFKYSPRQKALTDAVATIPSVQYFNQALPQVVTAFDALGKYAESNAQTAARNDNVVLAYVRHLKSELHLYWWVTGGWSTDAAKPFRSIGTAEAAVRSGKELADQAFNDVGLFAAPAMLDMILERGRNTNPLLKIRLRDAATSGDLAWRRETFTADGSGPFSDVLPVSTSLHLSVDSDDADDWHPRFLRLTGISVDAELDPVALGLQLYRERLLAKALA